MADLKRLRDATGAARINRADRPDVGHRRNIAEARGRRRYRSIAAGLVLVLLVVAVAGGYLYWTGSRGLPQAKAPRPAVTKAIDTNMISKDTMLSPQLIKSVINGNWKIIADQPAGTGDSPVPACLGQPQDDTPTPATAMIRTLSTSSNGPTALHLSEAYRSSELASESFALIAKSLGECNLQGSYISSARTITGIGDQATAILLTDPQKNNQRAVIANRTGQVVNVIDIAESRYAPDLNKAAAALAQLTDQQCTLAIGVCASNPQVSDGPPPVGGDEPGFLALADIPVPTTGRGTWGGLAPTSPAGIVTSGCEDVSFTTLNASSRAARSYVLTDKPKGVPETFGIDQIALTMRSARAAQDEERTIARNIKRCGVRSPTAQVRDDATVSGTGANRTAITGSVALVSQQITPETTSTYRVGIAAAGNKLVYTFLPRTKVWDLTPGEWSTLTVRAAQRATQVR